MPDEAYKWPYAITPPILFANGQWAVTRYGLECLTSNYPIEAKRLTERGPGGRAEMYDWPPHLAEKEWVDVPAFLEAFQEALRVHAWGHPQVDCWAKTLRKTNMIAGQR